MDEQNQTLSRKERRDLKREQKLEKRSQEQKSRTVRRVGLWGGVIVAIVFTVWGLTKLGGNSSGGDGPIAPVDSVTEGDWVSGSSTAKVTLIEYSDLQCPACAAAQPVVKQIEREFANDISFVYRHFPLTQIHKNAEESAWAAEAAGKQGKFFEMRDKLFDFQSSWDDKSDVAEIFATYAEQMGLDKNIFLADYKSDEVKQQVRGDMASGNRAGVNSTPTFFLNGLKLNLKNFSELTALVRQAVEQSKTATST